MSKLLNFTGTNDYLPEKKLPKLKEMLYLS